VFNTNRTRQYRPITGTVHLEKANNFSQTRLITKLNELELSKSLTFLQPKLKINEPEILVVQKEEKPKPASILKEKEKEKGTVAVIKKSKTKIFPTTKGKKKEVVNDVVAQIKPPAAEIANRIIETIQNVSLKSDSVTITLYDNGEVDGDTVSILINGKVIMPMQGLSTNAITKTIYITPDLGDSIQLIMYAENLGSIPPNTGLLILQDGESRYEIRFAGDLQKNSAIVLRRKPK
jgi:archaellum component FlaF (FlaF/FlaG flagellin family)